MTRISMTFATAALTLSLAPAANAYTPAPEAAAPNDPVATLAQLNGVCVLEASPILAAILNLPAIAIAPQPTTVACNS